jgi:hypothetical protein
VILYEFPVGAGPDKSAHRQGAEIQEQWMAEQAAAGTPVESSFGEDIVDGMVTISVQLFGATAEQAKSLADAFSEIPRIPEPRIVEADYYQVEAHEAKKRGELMLYEFDHAFVFQRGATSEQIEKALRDYLIQRDGKYEGEIEVDIEWTAKGHSCNIEVTTPD